MQTYYVPEQWEAEYFHHVVYLFVSHGSANKQMLFHPTTV